MLYLLNDKVQKSLQTLWMLIIVPFQKVVQIMNFQFR